MTSRKTGAFIVAIERQRVRIYFWLACMAQS